MPRRFNDVSSDGEPQKKKNCTVPVMSSFDGELLQDVTGKQWKLGKAVGVGGSGEIYLASDNLTQEVKTDSSYVAKVEDHKNGPLFVEVNCYLRAGKLDMIEEWKKQKKLKSLGMPHYVASGSHKYKGERYRFLILSKFDQDLEKVLQNKKILNIKSVLTIASQIIDVLEYIHNKGYIHSDIKASNILLSMRKITKNIHKQVPVCNPVRTCRIRKPIRTCRTLRPQSAIHYIDDIPNFDKIMSLNEPQENELKKEEHSKDQVYLLDYGLACKYMTSSGEHKPFCVDERKAHAGTILFCSRDAHKGVASRRSDLESLGYNMIYWLTGNLPWSGDIDNPELVDKKKQKSMTDVEYFLTRCFSEYPTFLLDYFTYLQKLQFQEKPDYIYCKRLFQKSIKANGYKNDSLLDFENTQTCILKNKSKKNVSENDRVQKFIHKVSRPPLQSNIPVKPSLRKKSKNKDIKAKANWFEVVDPEIIIKQAREKKNSENIDTNLVNNIVNMNIDTLNPTYAMIEVYNKCRERTGVSPTYKGDSYLENIEGYTYAMMSVLHKKKKREELEYEELAVNLINTRNGKTLKRCVNKRKKKSESPSRSPPHTRTAKSATVVKKEYCQARKLKNVPLRRTYSLRG